MLLCLKTAENTKTKFAVLGFRSLTTIAKSICNVLKIPTDIFSINTTSEASSLLDKLKEQGYKTVICDTVPYNYAKLILSLIHISSRPWLWRTRYPGAQGPLPGFPLPWQPQWQG